MTEAQIEQLMRPGALPEGETAADLKHTHISWVLLTPTYAYKFKKPLQFSFLDFSTLDKRHRGIAKELELNSRMEPEVYLDVLAVYQNGNRLSVGPPGQGEAVDYALRMRRLDSDRQMDIMLRKDLVQPQHLIALAEKLARFHRQAQRIYDPLDLEEMRSKFNDLDSISTFIERLYGTEKRRIIESAIQYSDHFLARHQDRLQTRIERGFIIDGHGDLHSKNIFLLPEGPVIFDCIEFNDDFRILDLLSEVGFFCMDLDAANRPDLGQIFLDHYQELALAFEGDADWAIFHYYKLYRANVRLKVNSMGARQQADPQPDNPQLTIYLNLLEQYLLEQ